MTLFQEGNTVGNNMNKLIFPVPVAIKTW